MAGARKGIKASGQDNFIGPSCISGLTVTNVGTNRPYNNGQINLSWTNPSTGNTPTGYRVYRNGSLIATVSHPNNTYSDTGLASATGYYYRVDSYDAYGTCAGTQSGSVTVTTVPATPGTPGATAGINQDTISWTAPADGGSAILDYYVESNDAKNATTASTSVVIAQEASTSQAYRVRARNSNGNSDFSAYSPTVTTLAPSFFSPPFFPPAFFAPPGFFAPPAFFAPPGFGGAWSPRFY